MLTLIKVELKKIFNKKSIYIIWGLMVIFCLLNNILYKTDYDDNGNYKYLEHDKLKQEEQQLQEELTKYNKDNENEVTMYITIKTKLDIINLKKKFTDTSWQYRKINDYLYDYLYQLNYYQYIKKIKQEHAETKQKYQTTLEKLQEDNYQYFLEIEQNQLQKTIKNIEEQLKITIDKKEQLELENQLAEQQFNLKILNYRQQNNIKEDNSYLNLALEEYQKNYKIVDYYQTNNLKRTNQEEIEYRNALSSMKENEYIVEHQQNINKQNNLNYQLRTIVEDYEIFFVILILILSGTIFCDEFKDGTIKLLLIKPYSRGKILLSKYLTIIFTIGISILGLITIQILIGGMIFGFDSLKIPVVVYHFSKAKMIEYSVIEYMGIRILARIPFLLMLISISMLIGIISSNSILSITIPLMLYMFSPSLEILATQYNLTIMKYLVNMNWNLQDFLFGNIKKISFISLKDSIIILIIYFMVLWILTFQIFKKKNIKNI